MRSIVVPAALAPAALAELKEWLAITTSRDDTSLIALLGAALEACEGFTGLVPIQIECEEVLRASYEWSRLAATPVTAILQVEQLAIDGTRTVLPSGSYLVDILADGCGRVRLLQPIEASRVVVRFDAGQAATWADLPHGLRHGVLRLAAHNYRMRDSADPQGKPPVAVAALWQPWRRLRLA